MTPQSSLVFIVAYFPTRKEHAGSFSDFHTVAQSHFIHLPKMRRLSRLLSGSTDTAAESLPAENKWIVEERSVDEARPLRVVIIGSGISGIIASVRFRQRIANLDICVYEKNEDVGGTWLENRYPGCACGMFFFFFLLFLLSPHVPRRFYQNIPHQLSYCVCATDIPAHTYQATFEPNKEWSTFYASAPEIYQYWKRVANKYGCGKYIKFKQQVVEAVWNETKSKWQLQVSICVTVRDQRADIENSKIKDVDTGSVYSDKADVLISATGALNNWKWPDIPGLHEFKGKLMHSAKWDESYDYSVRVLDSHH